MQNPKNKSLAILIALILTISTGTSILMIPATSAHNPTWTITDGAYIAAAPSPIGVGQTLIITIWTAQPLPNSQIVNNIRKENYQLIITAPDGTNTTQSWAVVQNTGGEQTATFVPSQIGSYTATFIFGGMTYPTLSQVTSSVPLSAAQKASINSYAGDMYTPGTAKTTFTVQQQSLPQTVYPLPTSYWTRPIEGENIYWYTIASNWLGPSSAQLGSFNEPGYNCFQPDGTAPNSGHILWTKPIEFGGVVGGSNTVVPGATFYSGSSYQPRIYNAIIMNGYLYFKMPLSGNGAPITNAAGQIIQGGAFVCLDLRTGQTIWTNSNSWYNPTWGQLYNEVDPNQSGIIPSGFLWQSFTVAPAVTSPVNASTLVPANVTWIAYDGWTGSWVFNITNVPQNWNIYDANGNLLMEQTTKMAYDQSGSLLIYVLDYNTTSQIGWLGLWNSTQLLYNPLGVGHPWRPEATVNDGSLPSSTQLPLITAYTWNVSITADLDGLLAALQPNIAIITNPNSSTGVTITGPSINAVINGDILYGTSSGLSETVGPQYTPNPFTMWAINLNSSKGVVGQAIWVNNYTAPNIMNGNPNLGSYAQRVVALDPQTRVVTMMICETMQWIGYSVDTGKQLWGPTTTPFPDGYQYFGSGLGAGQNAIDAYGKIYVQGYGGEIWCYDTSNGNLLWQFGNGGSGNSTNDGINSPWGLLPTMVTAVADGKVYAYTTQHGNGAQSPYYVNEMEYCLNATTGQQIWAMLGQSPNDGGPGYPENIIADGEMIYQNMYDNQIYAVGQGPSQTTVNAPNPVTAVGTPIVIRGTVTDISAGTKQNQQAADFPSGVPVVSDASQSQWMEYVYMQKPFPTNATGVPVVLSVIDSNGNQRQIGTATSDTSGMFTLTWTPDIAGNYTVIANFAGTQSYYPSSAETSFYASPAPTPAATPQPAATQAPVGMYITLAVVAIIVAIAIGFAATILTLKKRP